MLLRKGGASAERVCPQVRGRQDGVLQQRLRLLHLRLLLLLPLGFSARYEKACHRHQGKRPGPGPGRTGGLPAAGGPAGDCCLAAKDQDQGRQDTGRAPGQGGRQGACSSRRSRTRLLDKPGPARGAFHEGHAGRAAPWASSWPRSPSGPTPAMCSSAAPGWPGLADLPQGAKIGTSSLRRAGPALGRQRPDLDDGPPKGQCGDPAAQDGAS